MAGIVNGIFGKPGPSAAQRAQQEEQQRQTQRQAEAVAKQEEVAKRQNDRLDAQEAAEAAARRARQGMSGGRALLLNNEVGITGQPATQTKLGG